MHIKTITEQDLEDLLYGAFDLDHEPETNIITGVGGDVGRFTLIQGGFSTSIVLVSEFPIRVLPPEPTAEELEEFDRGFAALMAERDAMPPPTA